MVNQALSAAQADQCNAANGKNKHAQRTVSGGGMGCPLINP
jgi:hypothetical protein